MASPSFKQAPAWALCPGSQALLSQACNAVTQRFGSEAECAKVPGCTLHAGACMPEFMVNISAAELEVWTAKLNEFDPSVVGSCAGTCYVRQATSCAAGPSGMDMGTHKGAEGWCKSKPHCRWLARSCEPNHFGTDAWGAAANKAADLCGTLSSSTHQCLNRQPFGSTVQPQRVAMWWNFPSARGDSAPVKCVV